MSCFSRLCFKENEYEKKNEITRPNHRISRKEKDSKSGIKIHTSNCNSLNYNSLNFAEKQFADYNNPQLYFASPHLIENQGRQLSFKEFEQMMQQQYSYYLASQNANDNANRPGSTQSSSNQFQLFKRENYKNINQRNFEDERKTEEESKEISQRSQLEKHSGPSISIKGKKEETRDKSKNDKTSKKSNKLKVSNAESKSKSKPPKSSQKNKKRVQTPSSKSESSSNEECVNEDDVIDLDDYEKELKKHQKTSKRGRNNPKAGTENSISNLNNTSIHTTKIYQDPYSCTVCENIYSNSIYYGTPIKTTFQCSYCHNFLNENSLRFYEMKYARMVNQTNFSYDLSSNITPTVYTQPSQVQQMASNYYNMPQSNVGNGYNYINQTFHQNPSYNRNAHKVSYTPGFSNQSNQNPSFMTNYSSVESLQYNHDGNRQPCRNPNDMDSFLHHTYDVVSKQSVQVPQLNNKKDRINSQSRNKSNIRKTEECSQVSYNPYQMKPLQTPACSEPSLSEFEEEMLETHNQMDHDIEEEIEEVEIPEEINRPPKEDCLLVFTNDNYEKRKSKPKGEAKKSKTKKVNLVTEPKKLIEKKNKDLSPIQDRVEDEDQNIDCLVLKDMNNGNQPASLAEIFKNKKKKLIEKIENREFDREELNEKYKVNLNVQKHNQSDLYSSENLSSITNKKKEPPIELIDRLRKGEKIMVSNIY